MSVIRILSEIPILNSWKTTFKHVQLLIMEIIFYAFKLLTLCI